jgi:GATA-binding protein
MVSQVASHLEQGELGNLSTCLNHASKHESIIGQRLENLSWRCWFLHSLMVEADNTKSKREFKRMTKSMGEKLDKEKGRSVLRFSFPRDSLKKLLTIVPRPRRSIEELQAPDFKGSDSTSKVKQRAEERERSRDVSNDGTHSMKGMQYTFPVAPPATSTALARPKPAPTPVVIPIEPIEDHVMTSADDTPDSASQPHEIQLPASPIETKQPGMISHHEASVHSHRSGFSSVVRFPALFNSDFSPTALLGPSATKDASRPRMSYGEDIISVHMNVDSSDESMSITRPAFEFPLDELMNSPDAPAGTSVEATEVSMNDQAAASAAAEFRAFKVPATKSEATQAKPDLPKLSTPFTIGDPYMTSFRSQPTTLSPSSDLVSPVATTVAPTPTPPITTRGRPRSSSKHHRDEDTFTPPSVPARSSRHTHSASVPLISSQLPYETSPTSASATPSRRNSLKAGRHAAPSATPPPRAQRPVHGNTAPGGVKSECANCGATSTPLWRRGLNDELNCNVSDSFRRPRIHYLHACINIEGLWSICETCELLCRPELAYIVLTACQHKRARPKTMKAATAESNRSGAWGPRQAEVAETESGV